MKIKTAIEYFFDSIEGLDGDTLRAYRLDLSRFAIKQGDMDVSEVDKFHLRRYLRTLTTKDNARMSLASENRHYATLRRFFAWLCEEDIISSNPMQNVRRRRPNKDLGEVPAGSIIKALEPEQIKIIFQRCLALRDKVLFLLIYTTGLRISEALHVKVEDIQDDHIIIRFTKGNKPRLTFISQKLTPFLREYLKTLSKDTVWLFPGSNNKPLSYERARQLFGKIIAGLSNSDGSALTIHQLRHTFATERVGHIDSILLMELLGHSDIKTTLRYAKATSKAAREAFKKFDSKEND